MENHETLMKDSDGAAKGDIITTVTTEKKAEEEKAEQEDAQMDEAETPEPTATTPLRHDTKVIHCVQTLGAVRAVRSIQIKEPFRGFEVFFYLVQREVILVNMPMSFQRNGSCSWEAAANLFNPFLKFELFFFLNKLLFNNVMAEENFLVAFSLTLCSRLGLSAFILCALY